MGLISRLSRAQKMCFNAGRKQQTDFNFKMEILPISFLNLTDKTTYDDKTNMLVLSSVHCHFDIKVV